VKKVLLYLFTYAAFSQAAFANDLSGNWKFEKELEYYGNTKYIKPPTNPTIQFVADKLVLSEQCIETFKKGPFFHDGVFQGLYKDGQNDEKINAYFKKNLQLDLKNTKYFYTSKYSKCNQIGEYVFLAGDKIVFVSGGDTIRIYSRVENTPPQTTDANTETYGRKLSQLPFNDSTFTNYCIQKMPIVGDFYQSTNKCGPVFYPYVVTHKSKDPLSQILANHYPTTDSAKLKGRKSNPKELHLTYVVFPPLKNVLLLTVNDHDRGEMDSGPPTYSISIKDGKVIDTIHEVCNFSKDYVCTDGNKTETYRLLETGKFQKIAKK